MKIFTVLWQHFKIGGKKRVMEYWIMECLLGVLGFKRTPCLLYRNNAASSSDGDLMTALVC